MSKRKVIVFSAALCLPLAICFQLAAFSPAAANTDRPTAGSDDSRQEFMRRKLSMVYNIVEGNAQEDFELVEKGAKNLIEIAESAEWQSTKDPYYRHYSASFQQAAKGLMAAAKSESVEKATYAYVHVTMSCTACHQHVRNTVRLAQ